MEPTRPSILQTISEDRFLHSNDKDSRTRLWNPVGGVNNHCANAIVTLKERLVKLTVMLPFFCRHQASHVLSNNYGRTRRHFIHHTQPMPHKAASRALNSFHVAGKRQVLTWKTCPGQRRRWEIPASKSLYWLKNEVIILMIGPVNVSLLFANIVGPYYGEIRLEGGSDETAACEKFDCLRISPPRG